MINANPMMMVASAPTIIVLDSYDETRRDNDAIFGPNPGWGQAFTLSSPRTLTSSGFYLKKAAGAAGMITAKVFAATGTVGTNAAPTGAALASASPISASTLGTTYGWVAFPFLTPYAAGIGNYCVTLEYSGYSDMWAGGDFVSPSHSGNLVVSFGPGSWAGMSTQDLCFRLYGY